MTKRYCLTFVLMAGLLLGLSTQASAQNSMKTLTMYEEAELPDRAPESLLDQSVSVDFENISLEEALQRLAEKGPFVLSYSKSYLPVNKPVTLQKNNISLNKALTHTLRGTRLAYTVTESGHLVISVSSDGSYKQAAADTVRGRVTDRRTDEPLVGVNIVIQGTTRGTSTDSEGQYTLDVPADADTLVFSYLGYQKALVPIGDRTQINVPMVPGALGGEEVVVVGYGEQQRTSVTSSVSEIDVQTISENNFINTEESLQGLSSGLTVRKSDSRPGQSDLDINIRGINTIGDTSPLILVDGIEQDLSDIDPQNVENISVLKDAAATAIYGSRGSNGVILVTTKDPREGELQVSYDGYYGIQQIDNKPDILGLEESLRLESLQYANRPGGSPLYTEEEIETWVNSDNRHKYPLQNPHWDVLFRDASLQHHSLTFSGGTERHQSRLNLNYSNTGGIMPKSNAERYGIDFSNSVQISDRVDLDTKLTYRNKRNMAPYRIDRDFPSIYFQLWHWTQWTVPQFPNGSFGNSVLNTNPLRDATMSGTEKERTDYAVANINLDVDILDNLTYTFQFGGHMENTKQKIHKRHFEIYDFFSPDQKIYDNGFNQLTEFRSRDTRWSIKNLLNYQVSFQDHRFDVLAGYEQTRDDFEWVNAFRDQFYKNDLVALNAGAENNQSNNGSLTEERLRSGFGRIQYNYDNRYLLEANARYDGSSRFQKAENQYSFFPSFSAGWRISNENFWEPLSGTVNELKLRGSWGESGNNAVSLYSFSETLNATNYVFGEELVQGFEKTTITNPDLSWETTTQTSIGFDAEMWEGLLGVTFDLYEKQTEGILLTLPVPFTVGLDPAPVNAGRVDNRGWELTVTHNNNVNSDLSYSIRANLSNNENEVVDLANSGPYTGFQVTKVGEPLESFWGYEVDGFFQSEEEIDNYPTFAGDNATFPGDLKYIDRNGDGQITPDDKTVIGNQYPHYQFGVDMNVNYRNFSASVFIQGVGQMNYQADGPPHLGGAFQGTIIEKAGDYWTPDNRDARFPRPQKFSHKNFEDSEWWTLDASYVRLRNVRLAYSLPTDVTNRLGINRMQVYFNGNNLYTISDVLEWGYGPENPANWNAGGYYPGTRNIQLGVNLQF